MGRIINLFWLIHITDVFIIQALTTNNRWNELPKNPVSVKFSKSIDIQLESNVENVNPTLIDLIKSQIPDNVRCVNSEKSSNNSENLLLNEPETPKIPAKDDAVGEETFAQLNQDSILSHLYTLTNKIQIFEDNLKNFSCKSVHLSAENGEEIICNNLIGTSKPPICDLLDDGKIKNNVPKSCREIQENGQNKSGLYEIHPKKSAKSIMVFCDMETKGGGWTVIQARFDGSQDFFKEWRDYKFGFGNLKGEFWLGLENIYHITGFEVNELLVEITDRDKVKAYAEYKAFGIGSETDGYPLNVLRGFSGDAGDSLTDHIGAKFSTKDLDQDNYTGQCAQLFLGAWWYKGCHVSNLNGKYINVPLSTAYKFQGLHWKTFRGHEYCHAGSRMLVKPVED